MLVFIVDRLRLDLRKLETVIQWPWGTHVVALVQSHYIDLIYTSSSTRRMYGWLGMFNVS